MSKNLLFGIGGLLIGLFIGFFAANRINRDADPVQNPASLQPSGQIHSQQIQSADIKEIQPDAMMPDVQQTLDKAKNEPQNIEAQIAAGDMYSQIGRFEQAIVFYQKAQEANPKNFQANVKLANAFFDTKQFARAEEFYKKALDINPDDVNARSDLGSVYIERENPDYDLAVKEFETSLKTDPNHQPTLYNLGIAYFKKGETEKVKQIISRLEKAEPNGQLTVKLKQLVGQS